MIRTAHNRRERGDFVCAFTLGANHFYKSEVDLTTLEKAGKFKALKNLICMYHGKRGLHLVVVYLVVGRWRERVEFSRMSGSKAPLPLQNWDIDRGIMVIY